MKFLLLLFVLGTVLAIPHRDQVALVNSLIVGRDNKDDLKNWICGTCDDSNKPQHTYWIQEEVQAIKCILSVYPDYIVLAFRYTNSIKNILEDVAYINKVKDEHMCSDCNVQAAQHEMWETIKEDVMNDLRQIQATEYYRDTMIISGISLGGGLATMSYVDIYHAGIFSDVDVVTFGAPRVGNNQWAEHFDAITDRDTKSYIIKDDPIPAMPRCLTIFCTYGNTGRPFVCHNNEKDAEFMECIEVPEYKTNVISSVFGHLDDHINGYPLVYNMTSEEDYPTNI